MTKKHETLSKSKELTSKSWKQHFRLQTENVFSKAYFDGHDDSHNIFDFHISGVILASCLL